MYVDGVIAHQIEVNGKMYYKGAVANKVKIDGKYYIDGKLANGIYGQKTYKDGVVVK